MSYIWLPCFVNPTAGLVLVLTVLVRSFKITGSAMSLFARNFMPHASLFLLLLSRRIVSKAFSLESPAEASQPEIGAPDLGGFVGWDPQAQIRCVSEFESSDYIIPELVPGE